MTGPEHHHHHAHPTHPATEVDWEAMGDRLELEAEVLSPFLDAAAAWLVELTGAAGRPVERVVDIGCGPGVATAVLAAAFPKARVLAVDTSASLLARAEARAARCGVGHRVQTRRGDLDAGRGADLTDGAPTDLVWAAMVVHHVGDQVAALATLRSLLRPGGRLALVEGDRTLRYLPADLGVGRPGLQDRLDQASSQWFAAMRASLPGAVEADEDWPAALVGVGFAEVTHRTFPVELAAPLSPAARRLAHHDLGRRRELAGDALDLLDAGDRAALDRLLDPEDPAGILRRDDLALRAARTVYTGTR